MQSNTRMVIYLLKKWLLIIMKIQEHIL